MKEMLNNDKCFAAKGSSTAFASDGVLRDHIDIEEARTAFDFTIEKRKCFTEDGREIGGVMHLRRSDDDGILFVAGGAVAAHGAGGGLVPRGILHPRLRDLRAVPGLHEARRGLLRGPFSPG